jgi:hypothetical protein
VKIVVITHRGEIEREGGREEREERGKRKRKRDRDKEVRGGAEGSKKGTLGHSSRATAIYRVYG